MKRLASLMRFATQPFLLPPIFLNTSTSKQHRGSPSLTMHPAAIPPSKKKLLSSYAGGSLPVTRTTRVQQLIWSGLIPITRTLHAPAPGLSLVQLYLHTQCLRFAHCTHEALPKAWRTQTGSHCLRCSPQPVSAVRVHG